MANIKIQNMENKWQAEEDARTLERYQEIMGDRRRLSRAQKQAQENLDNLQNRLSALKKSLTGIKKL